MQRGLVIFLKKLVDFLEIISLKILNHSRKDLFFRLKITAHHYDLPSSISGESHAITYNILASNYKTNLNFLSRISENTKDVFLKSLPLSTLATLFSIPASLFL